MVSTAIEQFVSAWRDLHDLPLPPNATPGELAAYRNRRRVAARVVADVAERWRYEPVTVRLTEWFDWESLRVNVYHLVSPKLVKWNVAAG